MELLSRESSNLICQFLAPFQILLATKVLLWMDKKVLPALLSLQSLQIIGYENPAYECPSQFELGYIIFVRTLPSDSLFIKCIY